MGENPHKNHRARVRERFFDEGSFEHFQPHQVLEMLLFFAVPQKDTNETAHALLARFGSVEEVLFAPIEELIEVKGVGEHAAILLHLFGELSTYLCRASNRGERADTFNRLSAYVRRHPPDRGYLLLFNQNYEILHKTILENDEGEEVLLRKMVKSAVLCQATSCVLVVAAKDKTSFMEKMSCFLQRLMSLLAAINVHLVDCIGFAEDNLFRFNDNLRSLSNDPALALSIAEYAKRCLWE